MKNFNFKNSNKIIYISIATVIIPIFAAQKNGKTDFGRVLEDNEAIKIDEEFANASKTKIDVNYESEIGSSNHQKIVSSILGITV